MSECIEIGDMVEFVYMFPNSQTSVVGEVVYIPESDSGFWHLRDKYSGHLILVNPTCSSLQCIRKWIDNSTEGD